MGLGLSAGCKSGSGNANHLIHGSKRGLICLKIGGSIPGDTSSNQVTSIKHTPASDGRGVLVHEPMLSSATLGAYRRDGFIVLPEILASTDIEALRGVTDRFVDNARTVTANNEVYDLEESHSPDEPRAAHQDAASAGSGVRARRPPSEDRQGAAGSVGNAVFRYR
jgi:hypothetical protein